MYCYHHIITTLVQTQVLIPFTIGVTLSAHRFIMYADHIIFLHLISTQDPLSHHTSFVWFRISSLVWICRDRSTWPPFVAIDPFVLSYHCDSNITHTTAHSISFYCHQLCSNIYLQQKEYEGEYCCPSASLLFCSFLLWATSCRAWLSPICWSCVESSSALLARCIARRQHRFHRHPRLFLCSSYLVWAEMIKLENDAAAAADAHAYSINTVAFDYTGAASASVSALVSALTLGVSSSALSMLS